MLFYRRFLAILVTTLDLHFGSIQYCAHRLDHRPSTATNSQATNLIPVPVEQSPRYIYILLQVIKSRLSEYEDTVGFAEVVFM